MCDETQSHIFGLKDIKTMQVTDEFSIYLKFASFYL